MRQRTRARICSRVMWFENPEQLTGSVRCMRVVAEPDKAHSLCRFQKITAAQCVETVAAKDLLGDSEVQSVNDA